MAEGLFAEKGYIVARSAISVDDRSFLWTYILQSLGSMKWAKGDRQVPGTPAVYGNPVMETLLEKVQPMVEKLVGLDLFPTYSYVRLYKTGDELAKHTDRPSCEISTTLCVGYEPDQPWPIWIESDGDVEVVLLAGDMLVYKGRELPHWRRRYSGNRLAQVFLHYVDQHGACSEWKFDKRSSLRKPPPCATGRKSRSADA
jgi:hypothetical protein